MTFESDDLTDLGWDEALSEAFADCAEPEWFPGRVGRVDRGGWLRLETAAGPQRARLHPRFRRVMDPVDLPTVGDWVAVAAGAGGDPPLAQQVLPRRSAFVRGDAETAQGQAIAANIDTAFVLLPADGDHSDGRIDRFLSLTWSSGAAPVILVTKADAVDDAEARARRIADEALGVPVHAVSARDGIGLEALDAYQARGRTIVLLGASGVGKSTLANRLMGEEVLATSEVRRDGRGRHTTTHRELLRLPGGGVLIDTPGLRTIGMFDRQAAEDQTFADVEEVATSCRFSDCAHAGEPGCAVLAALDSGELSAERWDRYVALQRERAYMARKQDPALRLEETRRWKQIEKQLREHYRYRER